MGAPNNVNIIYDFNGGQNTAGETQKTQTYASGTQIEIYDPTINQDTHELDIKKDGRYFVGWQTTNDYSDGKFYNPGEKINLTQDTTLYARWSNYLFVGGEQKNSDGQYSPLQFYLCPNGLTIPFAYELYSGGSGSGKYYCQYYQGYAKNPNADAELKSSCIGLRLDINGSYKSFLAGNSCAAFKEKSFGNANRYYKDFKNNCIVGEWDLADGDLLLKIKIYYDGLRYANMKWEVSNKTQEKIFKDLKLVHGSDTYFYGADSGTSFCSTDMHMVYLKNQGYYGLMCFYGDEYSKPSHFYSGPYSGHGLENFENGGNLRDVVNTSPCDNGFYLQWDKSTLGPGETWEIGAFESFTEPKVLLGLISAPMTILKGQTARYNARIQNFYGLPKTINLQALSEHGFETKIFDSDGNEINSLEVPGQNGFKEIILEQYIPIGTEYKSDQLTLKLTDADDPENNSEASVKTSITDEIRVIYYGNGNTSGTAPESQKYSVGQDIIVSDNANDLVKDGFNFCGWSENAAAKPWDDNVYKPGDSLEAKKDIMLQAVWSIIASQTEKIETEYGNNLTFEVNPCEVLTNLEYKWYKNGERIPGDSKILNINKPEVKETGNKYYCEITGVYNGNTVSEQSKTLELKVKPKPLDIKLSHTGTEKIGSKINLKAEITNELNGLLAPTGKIKFTVDNGEIGLSEIKKSGDKYYSEIDWQTDKCGYFDFKCEYVANQNDNYENGVCDQYRITVKQPLDSNLSHDGDTEINNNIKIIAEVKNIVEDFGDPTGKIKFIVNDKEVGLSEIKKSGDKYVSEIDWQIDKGGYFDFKCEYVANQNDNYENGVCNAYGIDGNGFTASQPSGAYKITLKQPLDLTLSCDGYPKIKNSNIKITAELKNIVKDFGDPMGKIKFIVNGQEVGLSEIKKVGDKYYGEIDWETNMDGNFDFMAEYVAAENDNYENGRANNIQIKVEPKSYDWNSYAGGNGGSNANDNNDNFDAKIKPESNNFSFDNGFDDRKIGTYKLRDIKIPEEIKRKGFITGYPDKSFRPESFITRAETAQMIYNLIYDVPTEKNLIYNNKKYSDLENHWANKSILFLANRNIMVFDDLEFKPDKYMTRAEFAQVLFEVFMYFDDNINKLLVDGDIAFEVNDLKNNISLAVRQLASNGIMVGYDDKSFRPDSNIKRSEVVSLITKAFDFYHDIKILDDKYFIDLDKKYWAYKIIMEAAY